MSPFDGISDDCVHVAVWVVPCALGCESVVVILNVVGEVVV